MTHVGLAFHNLSIISCTQTRFSDIVACVKPDLIPDIQQALAQKDLALCGELLHRAFRTQAFSYELVHLSALWHHQSGRIPQAINVIKALLHQKKGLPHTMWNDLGVLYTHQANNHLAEKCFQNALGQTPHEINYLQNYAQALLAQKKYAQALDVFQYLSRLQKKPDADFFFIIQCLLGLEKYTEAHEKIQAFKAVTNPEYVMAKAHFLKITTSPQAALDYLQTLPPSLHAHDSLQYLRAEILLQQGNNTAALHIFKALYERTRDPHLLPTLGNIHKNLKAFSQAIASWEQFLLIQPQHAETLYNLANTFAEQQEYTRAIEYYQKALNSHPEFTEAWINLTLAYYEQKEYALAESAAKKAVELAPDNARAHIGYGDALLMQKKYAAGFQEIEWRFAEKNYTQFKYPAPPWTGQDLNHKHILVMSEQGLGDIIMLSRFLFDLQARYPDATISFRCRPELVTLFQDWPFSIYADGTTVQHLDYAVALMSLLKVLQINPESLPPPDHLRKCFSVPHPLPIAPTALPQQSTSLNIGLVWRSGAGLTQQKRSAPAETFAWLMEQFPHHTFYGMQKDHPTPICFQTLSNYQSLSPYIKDFTDTAAYCQHLDLIVSVDTSVAHLAGTLNRPTWIVLPFSPDWRWGGAESQSPWYPSARLFRQSKPGDWLSVMQDVAETLRCKY